METVRARHRNRTHIDLSTFTSMESLLSDGGARYAQDSYQLDATLILPESHWRCDCCGMVNDVSRCVNCGSSLDDAV